MNYHSGWKGKNFGNVTEGPNQISIAVNIYGSSRICWAITPPVNLSATTTKQLSFDTALTNYDNTTQGSLDTDDSVFVAYSLDGGFTWSYDQILKRLNWSEILFLLPAKMNEVDLTSIGSEKNVSFAFYAVYQDNQTKMILIFLLIMLRLEVLQIMIWKQPQFFPRVVLSIPPMFL